MGDVVTDRVLAIVRGVVGPSRTMPDAGPGTPLAEEGFWLDSVELLEVIVACEEAFEVTFDPDTDVTQDSLRTVGTLVAAIKRKQAA